MSFKNKPDTILNAILQMCSDPILLIEHDLNVCDANTAFKDIVGQAFSAPLPFERFLERSDQAFVLRKLRRVFEEQHSTFFEARILSVEHAILWFDWTLDYDPELDRAILIGRNITPHRHTLNELAAVRTETETRQRAEDIFVAKMNHELRTPLHAIMGYSQLLQRRKSLTESDIELVNHIRENGKSLLALIDSVLEQGKKPSEESVELEKVFVTPLLRNVIEEFRIRSTENNIELIFVQDRRRLRPIIADIQKLQFILRNLLDNAFKFTDYGSVVVRLNTRDDNVISIDIIDSGRGIEKDAQAKIFDPFEKGCRFDQDCGIGLGLAVAKKYCNQLNFRLEVEALEDGAKFTILFNSSLS